MINTEFDSIINLRECDAGQYLPVERGCTGEKFWNNIANAFSTPANAIFSVLDLVVTILIVYYVVIFFKKNNASRLVKYLAVLIVLSCVVMSGFLNMPVLSHILSNIIFMLLIAAVILFAPEIKRMMWKISSPKATESSYATQYDCSDEELHAAIDDIVRAAQNMSKRMSERLL